MGYVIPLNIPFRQPTQTHRLEALMQRFASERRKPDDVFWLKENAELLNILHSLEKTVAPDTLDPLTSLYDALDTRLGFFPQYYRFFLSICLDLEDLGLDGGRAEHAVDWVISEGLVEAELSDLQRAEARRLCQRRGRDPISGDTGLDDRLRAFTARRETFALPNKKAAYELTHIVFYLSQYGHKAPRLPEACIDSLHFAGTLAFLELNIDLLAEICIALRFAGHTPPAIWEDWLHEQKSTFRLKPNSLAWIGDDYHPYFMVNWFADLAEGDGFKETIPEGPLYFSAPKNERVPLREISECMYRMDGARLPNWPAMRRVLDGLLSVEAREMVAAAETAIDFDAFFAGFSRSRLQGDRA
ncbi:MAG: hypothetical protein AAGF53_05835 [Pseudomonadota bacterium]